MQFIKNVLLAIFVLILSAGIFFFLVKDQKITDDILKSTLQLFGDDLMAMVPDGEQKELLIKKYDDFLHKADKEELPPEEIERVAAAILNLTSQDSVVLAEEALTALNLNNKDYIYPPKVPFPEQVPAEKRIFDKISGKGKLHRPEHYEWNEQDKRDMAERLSKVKEFHIKFHKRIQQDTTLKALQEQVLFNSDSGLTVTLNLNLKNLGYLELDSTLQTEIENLEKEKILVWKESIAHQKEAEKALKIVLKQIPTITANIGLMGKSFQNTGMFDSIIFDQKFNADSLQKFIEIKLKEVENSIPDSLKN